MAASQKRKLNLEKLNQLKDVLAPDRVSYAQADIVSYSRDMWPRSQLAVRDGRLPQAPEFIVWPETTEEVSRLIRLANEMRFPVVPFGAGTGVCGGAQAMPGAVIVDMKRMDRMIDLSGESLYATVETGIVGEHLERLLNRHGYTLGHFPSSIYCSTLGGFLATRSAGQLSTKYGKIEDMVISLQAVLPDGSIIRTRNAPRRATGPDLNHLLLGSEGTLAVITEASLRIWEKPEAIFFRSFVFSDVFAGMEAMRKLMRAGVRPSVVRLYDEADTALSMSAIGYEASGCLLILATEGHPLIAEKEMEVAGSVCRDQGGKDTGEEPARHWWDHRYSISYNQSPILSSEGMILDTIEVAATWSRLPDLYRSMNKAISAHLTCLAHFSHAYPEGCSIYFTAMGKADKAGGEEALYDRVWDDAMKACLKHGGTVSHHHGVGLLRAKWLKEEFGKEAFAILQGLKRRLDPNNVMNPGKLGM